MRWSAVLALLLTGCGGGSADPCDGPCPPTDTDDGNDTDAWVQETFVAAPDDEVDILFVVDHAPGATDLQTGLVEGAESLFGWLDLIDTDWHVGVVSGDMVTAGHGGRLREADGVKWIDGTTYDRAVTWPAMVQMGTSGPPTQEGRAAAYTALETLAGTDNAGFLRADSSLHIVAVSHFDDASDDSVIGSSSFIAWGWAMDHRPLVRFTGIVDAADTSNYWPVISGLNGSLWSDDAAPWATLMRDVGRTSLTSPTSYVLAGPADPASLEVSIDDGLTVTGLELDSDFTYDDETWTVELVIVPGFGSEVLIGYLPGT